ncbi:MAG: helix-hairpin-helix domain-containing protein [Desulfobacterales bacterium]|jgi:DNA excision repair protein ERCC-4|nr:helix-hairpin-helix domain-containing protein [Desulfobacterales bacterium]
MNDLKITVDYRETASGITDLLKNNGALVEIAKLSYGDYIINDTITVERKTAKDFLISIIDGRLFNQLSNLKKFCNHPILLIEGNPYETDHNFDRMAIKGALVSTQTIWYVPVVFSRTKEDSRDILLMISRQVGICIDVVPLRGGYRPKRLKSKQLYLLQGFPQVGPKLAKRLILHFKSVSKIMNASVQALTEVDGIGKISAERIREVLDAEVY